MSNDRSLVRHPDFRRLWAAETVSQVGTQVTLLALPVLAVSLLDATPLQMGYLTALETAAFLLIGLPAGAWVDRWRRKRVLVTADLVRAVVLGTLPLAYLLDVLTLGQLFVVAALTGTATVFFDVAYQSYLPALVDRDQLVDGNGKLEASRAVAQVAGPGVTGVLLRVMSAPVVIALDAASFLLSAFFLGRIRRPDVVPDRAGRRSLRAEIGEGLSFVVRQPLLRRIVACTGTSNLFSSITTTLLVLYALRELELSESTLGLVFSAGAVGGLVGAATAARFARRVGEGRAIPLAILVALPFTALTPLAAVGAPLVLLTLGQLGFSWSVVVYNVTQVSFRQRLCPPALLGRMNASVRFIVFGTMPLGGLLGGVLGTWLGVLPALWIAAAGQVLAAGWVVASPLRHLRELPGGPDDPAVPVVGLTGPAPGSPPGT
ncbi:MFS transporter [Modestobacter roseus]|uniref:Putative MFS family arabinose efflux permease n=1 Tax=Modestobacter roseus TaxID=1181884 RepID=A0A562IT82_9ACTN|nr:MFS transporter [Modestobacter roseus]MQA32592.1 MFS transporter [Modestobacter roseus]TWH73764.1 putative MFS family arabinose efflux permease [Modestobacter roseus]